MNMELNILLSRLQSIHDSLHWLIAKIEIICTLDKKGRLDIVAVKGFKEKAQRLLLAIYLAKYYRFSQWWAGFGMIEIPCDTEFSVYGNTNFGGFSCCQFPRPCCVDPMDRTV